MPCSCIKLLHPIREPGQRLVKNLEWSSRSISSSVSSMKNNYCKRTQTKSWWPRLRKIYLSVRPFLLLDTDIRQLTWGAGRVPQGLPQPMVRREARPLMSNSSLIWIKQWQDFMSKEAVCWTPNQAISWGARSIKSQLKSFFHLPEGTRGT
jgi:hypothetical protein